MICITMNKSMNNNNKLEILLSNFLTLKISNINQNIKHKITCIGDKPGIRFAITAPDVDHVYTD